MAENGGLFRGTSVTLLASLLAPIEIWLHRALQMTLSRGLTEPDFG